MLVAGVSRLRLALFSFVPARMRGGFRVGASVSVCARPPNLLHFGAEGVIVRSLTPVEAAVAFALGGSVLAVAIPEFVRGLHASRLAEPVDGLKRIAASAVSVAAAGLPDRHFRHPFPYARDVPRGVRADDPAGAWDQPTWRALGFGFDHAHAFSFSFESTRESSVAHFRATAHGDLDGERRRLYVRNRGGGGRHRRAHLARHVRRSRGGVSAVGASTANPGSAFFLGAAPRFGADHRLVRPKAVAGVRATKLLVGCPHAAAPVGSRDGVARLPRGARQSLYTNTVISYSIHGEERRRWEFVGPISG